ncbi:MAG: hypothetical protein J7L44_01830 [Candidatus Diapherotrites archaeon]|nr:hypothetical protein [Candidatus Diapherotrites archaeon]
MQNKEQKAVVLNFSREEKCAVKKALADFPEKDVRAPFEEKRWLIDKCTVTLYKTGKLVIQGKGCENIAKSILKKLLLKEELVLGIDEAGRGEPTGAFTISAVLADKNRLRELRDSKKTKKLEEKRVLVEQNCLASLTAIFSPEFIDVARKSGITMNELQRRFIVLAPMLFKIPALKFKVKVDGARIKGAGNAEFVVGGDDKCPVIASASVLAKLAREDFANKRKRRTWKAKR